MALGVVVLVVVLRVERPATLWWRRQALCVQLCASVAASGGAAGGVAALASAPYGDWAVPAGWSAAGMVDPESLDTVVVMSGVLLGTLAGTSVMYRIGWFDAGGPLGLRAARWVLGTVVAVAIWYAEREVLPESGASTFVAFAVLALWVQLGAPVLFIRLGLMEPAATAEPAVSAGGPGAAGAVGTGGVTRLGASWPYRSRPASSPQTSPGSPMRPPPSPTPTGCTST
ncbi:hypothetical protein [Nonomuraea salmonea]|uniref:hypothetical protein n=1 Tax=Nonomuraea salmonea TaxID=46181 RepID=UPI002FE9B303